MLRQLDLPEGSRVEQVLTGFWFGLESAVLDRETQWMLEDHRAMLARGVPRGDAARTALESELRRRLGTFHDTSLERMAASIAAKVHAEQTRPLTPAGREALRARVEELVRQRRNDDPDASE